MEAPPTVIIRKCCVINAGNNCLILFSNKVPVQLLTLVFIFSEISWIFPRSYIGDPAIYTWQTKTTCSANHHTSFGRVNSGINADGSTPRNYTRLLEQL